LFGVGCGGVGWWGGPEFHGRAKKAATKKKEKKKNNNDKLKNPKQNINRRTKHAPSSRSHPQLIDQSSE